MIKGELETIERYVQELEALRHYPRVKAERESLAAEAAQLQEKVRQLITRVDGEVSTNKKLSSQLSKKESEAKETGRKLSKAQRELSSLKDFKAKLPVGNGLSLERMKEQFLHAQEDEIERRTKERLTELERQMRSQMPALVQKELVRVLGSLNWPPEIKEVVSLTARRIADEGLRDREKWPDWFKDYYFQQVQEAVAKGLDLEFEHRVGVEAQKRLEVMKAGQWEKYIAAKVRQLATELRGLVGQLQGTWWFNCDRCGRRIAIETGPSEIGQLLGAGTVDIVCSACLDQAPFPFILSSVPHKVASLTLGALLRLYLGEAPSAG